MRWFQSLDNKSDLTFFQFDIEQFYPSISEELLRKSLIWARDYAFISDKAIQIIMAARKSFLFDGKDVWVKKVNAHFDVTIGAYDGAEACEIVGLYLLNKLTKIYKIFKPEEIGIFRDGGLSVMGGSGPEKDRKRKEIIRIFKEENLNITWEINIKKV